MRSFSFLFLLCLGCKSAPEVTSSPSSLALAEETLIVVSQNLTQVELKYTGTLEATELTLNKARWEFVVDGEVVRSGSTPLSASTPAGAALSFSLSESLTYVKDEVELKTMSERGGSLLLAIRGVVVAHTSTGDSVEIPFAKAKEVRTPRVPRIKMTEFEAGRFSESEVQAVFHLGVTNSNPFPISLTGIDYAVRLGGKEIGKGTLGAGEQVSAASTGVFDVTATLNQDTHGKEAAKLVKSKVIGYELQAKLRAPLFEELVEQRGDIKLTGK